MERIEFSDLMNLSMRLTPQWLAGFFDGEGCVSAYWQGGKLPVVEVSLTQADLALMTMICLKFGGGPYQSERRIKKNHRIAYRAKWAGTSARPLLEYIKDHVILKKKPVEAALDFIDLIGKGEEISYPNQCKRAELAKKIAALNDSGKPAVN